MASNGPPSHKQASSNAQRVRASPGLIQTNNLTRNPRYSYLETPVEMQASTFQQFSSPTNSTIDESPITPRRAYTDSLYGATPVTAIAPEKSPVERTASPYGFPPTQQVHPAYFAPVEPASAEHMQQSVPASPGPLPVKVREEHETNAQVARQEHTNGQEMEDPPKKLAQKDRVHTVYNPDSLAGPNCALENHRPGQVSHPNAAVDPEWKHGLCTPDALCCLGLFCPCIIYGKTQYRLSKRAQKQDPTDLLGYKSSNGSCGIFALACGFQCKLPCGLLSHDCINVYLGALAAIQRKRVRNSYHLRGGLGSDCLTSLCCYCCVVAQNEREVRDREDSIRRNAGPASAVYVAPGTMTYAPPPK